MTRDVSAPNTPLSDEELVRSRQRSRARIMGVLLGAMVVLIFAISIVKIKMGLV